MSAFNPAPQPGHIAFTPGTYFVVGRDWRGEFPDPRGSDRPGIQVAPGEELEIIEHDGLEILILPIGEDDLGGTGRSIAIGDATIVAFCHIAFVKVPGDEASERTYPYAGHIDEVVRLDIDAWLNTDRFEFVGDTVLKDLDVFSPGAFSMDGEFIDMNDPVTADAFGYGTEEFNAQLDEHGFPCNLEFVRRRIRARTDMEGIALLNRLDSMGEFKIAYYAPVTA